MHIYAFKRLAYTDTRCWGHSLQKSSSSLYSQASNQVYYPLPLPTQELGMVFPNMLVMPALWHFIFEKYLKIVTNKVRLQLKRAMDVLSALHYMGISLY